MPVGHSFEDSIKYIVFDSAMSTKEISKSNLFFPVLSTHDQLHVMGLGLFLQEMTMHKNPDEQMINEHRW